MRLEVISGYSDLVSKLSRVGPAIWKKVVDLR
jgi:hypothetical protein